MALTSKRRASFAEVAEVAEAAGEAEGDQIRVRLKGAVMRWYRGCHPYCGWPSQRYSHISKMIHSWRASS